MSYENDTPAWMDRISYELEEYLERADERITRERE